MFKCAKDLFEEYFKIYTRYKFKNSLAQFWSTLNFLPLYMNIFFFGVNMERRLVVTFDHFYRYWIPWYAIQFLQSMFPISKAPNQYFWRKITHEVIVKVYWIDMQQIFHNIFIPQLCLFLDLKAKKVLYLFFLIIYESWKKYVSSHAVLLKLSF